MCYGRVAYSLIGHHEERYALFTLPDGEEYMC